MSLYHRFHSALWDRLPAGAFDPQEGDRTVEGMTLTKAPSLTAEDHVRFAVFSDVRFYKEHLYHKLLPFLPKEFTVLDGPSGQNCFMHCLDIPPQKAPFGRREFDAELTNRSYAWQRYADGEAKEGDIIVYSVASIIDSVREHAALYVGDGRVQSRWGHNSPLVEHPLKEVLPTYWNGDDTYLTIERRT